MKVIKQIWFWLMVILMIPVTILLLILLFLASPRIFKITTKNSIDTFKRLWQNYKLNKIKVKYK